MQQARAPPLHPRKRLYNLLEEIADSTIQRVEIRYQGLDDDEALELAAALVQNESLLELDLTSSTISTTGMTQIVKSLPSCLQNVSLSSNPISPTAASALLFVLSSNLLELHLHDCHLKCEGLAALMMTSAFHTNNTTTGSSSSSSSLKVLTLSKNQLSSCPSFSALQNLERLDLSCNRLTSLQELQLHKLPSLQRLHLWNNRLGPTCGTALGEILLHCRSSSLQELNLRNNELENVGIIQAFSLLEDECNLETLFLSSNLLSDPAVQHIASSSLMMTSSSSIIKFPHLKSLYLTYNNIGDDGAVALAHALSNFPNLKTLDLYRNNIGNKGGLALATAVLTNAENVHLTELNLNCNSIMGDRSILRTVRFCGKINRAGRYLLLQHENTIPEALWPHVLEKMQQLEVLYYFVHHLPELFLMRRVV
jgi:Ran GTPase-activating protein (RanGAP) involved in mRNA processing and transport